MLLNRVTTFLSIGSLALGAIIPKDVTRLDPSRVLVERQASTSSSVPDGQCTNGPKTRNCWSSGFSISTDFDAKAPPAGKEVTYNLVITNTTLNPDGAKERRVMLLHQVDENGQASAPSFPGPTIRASWGDTLIINVKNELQDNGTGIHWHGIRQLNSCQHDGVPGVTECPIAPGKTRQYRFKCTQFGTTWYHSHWSAQYAEGVVGTVIIDGPATANYDEDLGTVALSDWYYKPGFELNEQAQLSRTGPPAADNILVNGKHKSDAGSGEYFKLNVKKGKKYRVRLINTSVDTAFHVSFDGHPFTVITADFVPVKSYVTDQVTLNIGKSTIIFLVNLTMNPDQILGQRHDVIINANQTAGNYWARLATGGCGRAPTHRPAQLGAILHYEGADDNEPTTTGVTMRTGCDDETSLVPFVPNEVPANILPQDSLDIGSVQDNTTDNLFRWTIDGSTFRVNWNQPSLKTVLESGTDFGNNSNVYEIKTKNDWYLWWIQNPGRLAHPIHLHGHDFYIVGRGTGTWDRNTANLQLKNPTRRDTAMLPGAGYLLLAFPADNPGVWVMHCHIAWHASQGLSVQFLENYNDISGAIGSKDGFNQGCNEWNQYWQPGNHPYEQTDSGI